MKILITPRSFAKTDNTPLKMLEEAGIEVVRNTTGGIMSTSQLIEAIKDCDGLIVGVDPVSQEVIDAALKLKAIAKYGVGVDNIDVAYCEQKGIAVSRTIGANSDAVADYTFSLLLAAAKNIIQTDKKCRDKDWGKISTLDVFGKTIGIIGLGAIGKGVALRAKGFNMKILAYDMYWDDDFAVANGIIRTDLNSIYREADFISLHLPLTSETSSMISKNEIELMKNSTVIINTARGGLIDEPALLEALKNRRIHAAAIDAFCEEPPRVAEWYGLENLIMSSHAAASSIGATNNMGLMATTNIIKDLI